MRFRVTITVPFLLFVRPALVAASALKYSTNYWNDVPLGATTYDVIVGFADQLLFVPNELDANVGDRVNFHFQGLNHSVSQSSLQQPCVEAPDGFRSGFQFNPTNNDGLITTITVTDPFPKYFFCSQLLPTDHCQRGMVFAINAGDTMDQFLRNVDSLTGNASNNSAEQRNTYLPPYRNQSSTSTLYYTPTGSTVPLFTNTSAGASTLQTLQSNMTLAGVSSPFPTLGTANGSNVTTSAAYALTATSTSIINSVQSFTPDVSVSVSPIDFGNSTTSPPAFTIYASSTPSTASSNGTITVIISTSSTQSLLPVRSPVSTQVTAISDEPITGSTMNCSSSNSTSSSPSKSVEPLVSIAEALTATSTAAISGTSITAAATSINIAAFAPLSNRVPSSAAVHSHWTQWLPHLCGTVTLAVLLF